MNGAREGDEGEIRPLVVFLDFSALNVFTRFPSHVGEQPNLPGFILVASQTDKELQPTEVAREVHHAGVRERVARIRTKGDARDYFEEVRRKAVAAEPEL
jgi:hypothetical protein